MSMEAITVMTPDGTEAGRTVELPGEIFDARVNVPLIHQVVTAQLAGARQGTHDTKTRGEVRGGGRKPYRHKGTGRARQGSLRAPQFTGGGVVHGPTPRNYEQRTPKKMKAAALRGALSDRARGGRVHVVATLVDGDVPSTKRAAGTLRGLGTRNILAVVDRSDEVAWLSLRNLPAAHVVAPDQLNTYDVLVADDIVFTEQALSDFVERVGARVVVHEAPMKEPIKEPAKEPAKDTAKEPAKAPAKKTPAKSETTRSRPRSAPKAESKGEPEGESKGPSKSGAKSEEGEE